jgi:hypothetical protein
MAVIKRRLQWTLLALCLAWPPAHMLSSRAFKFSSWRFFGWGMYATPHPEGASLTIYPFGEPRPIVVTGNDELGEDLALFWHVHSYRSLAAIVERVAHGKAIAVVSRQRVDLTRRAAFVQEERFLVSDHTVRKLD